MLLCEVFPAAAARARNEATAAAAAAAAAAAEREETAAVAAVAAVPAAAEREEAAAARSREALRRVLQAVLFKHTLAERPAAAAHVLLVRRAAQPSWVCAIIYHLSFDNSHGAEDLKGHASRI